MANLKIKTKNDYYHEIISLIKSKQPNLPKIKKLINSMNASDISINAKKYRGRTLAHYAVKYHNLKVLNVLIKNGINLEICDDDYNTPLHMAILNKDYEMVEYLIKNGADINSPAAFEQTPLHLSITTNNIAITKLLLANGADASLVDEANLRAIDYAIDEKNQAAVELLISYTGGQE